MHAISVGHYIKINASIRWIMHNNARQRNPFFVALRATTNGCLLAALCIII
ncbi:hypothetical protein IT895_13520 [Halomonas sp. A40-4]|uniref:hypothetical protein n=1 Tax=Halomonas sp. A40-4 TaxID=2785909 RepID=UPI0018EFB449|nr:hypothetical protein [Halomonas sp. A40-4]QPL45201.1 hypothetical protein IT895_13520 [Halomonas sp. A40-4]